MSPSNAYGEWLLRNRWLSLALLLVVTLLAAAGGSRLYFDTDYRVFFGQDNPQLQAFEQVQQTYTKIDNVNFAITGLDGRANSPEVLAAVEALTAEAWQLPYSIRVDSLANHQHTEVDEDDLVVRDLFVDAQILTDDERQLVDQVATTEPALAGRLHDRSHRATSVNVTIQLPGESSDEVTEVTEAARAMAAEIQSVHPVDIRLGGVILLNNAFQESSIDDMATLIPAMYLMILVIAYVLLRSFKATAMVLVVIVPSILVAMGIGGWMGIGLTPPSASAPTIITTLAVADSIHLLVSFFNRLGKGDDNRTALLYSIRVNAKPIFLTSVTTALGFLSLNFSDSPPFHDLGNITAVGVMAAWLYAMVLLPILISFFTFQSRGSLEKVDGVMDKLGNWVASRHRQVLWGGVGISAVLLAAIPLNEINDDFVKYFDESVEFRQDTDWISSNLTGAYPIQFDLKSSGPNASVIRISSLK